MPSEFDDDSLTQAFDADDVPVLGGNGGRGAPLGQTGAEADYSYTETFEGAPARGADMRPTPATNAGQRFVQAPSFDAGTSRFAQPITARRRVGIAVIVVLCVLAAVAAFFGITYSLELWGGKEVPNVVGLERTEAEQSLVDTGFAVSFEEIASDEVAGTVLWTNPEPGSRAEEGSLITLGIARARVMPDVVGMTIEDARTVLEQEGLTHIEEIEQPSDEREGTVLVASPQSGETMTATTPITLTVATPHRVPDVSGMAQRSAMRLLEEAGYVVAVASVVNEDVELGTVVSIDPEANTALALGSTVTITVAEHQSDELIETVRAYLESLSDFRMNEKNYELLEVTSVAFDGGMTCRYTLRARPFEDQGWTGEDGRRRYGSAEELSGTVSCSDGKTVISSDPVIEAL